MSVTSKVIFFLWGFSQGLIRLVCMYRLAWSLPRYQISVAMATAGQQP